MILYINTTDTEKVEIGLYEGKKLVKNKAFKAKYRQSEKLLPEIDKLLKSAKKKPKDIHGIAVVKGPGPFTALRIGVATANALGYALGVPVVGIKKESNSHASFVETLRKWNGSWTPKRAVEPVYGREPNITTPLNTNDS